MNIDSNWAPLDTNTNDSSIWSLHIIKGADNRLQAEFYIKAQNIPVGHSIMIVCNLQAGLLARSHLYDLTNVTELLLHTRGPEKADFGRLHP